MKSRDVLVTGRAEDHVLSMNYTFRESQNLNLWPIGNCQASALIDEKARMVWSCLPRFDSPPIFSALLQGTKNTDGEVQGFWSIELEDCVQLTQKYERNTAILVTEMRDRQGSGLRIQDFSPRFQQRGRSYRPVALARIVTPLSGSPRVRVRLRPVTGWTTNRPTQTLGSNHIRFPLDELILRLTTDAPIRMCNDERCFRVEKKLHFFLGPDESFVGDIAPTLTQMLNNTRMEWRSWVRGLATPPQWQEEVIRAAITLKLCQYEETGAIIAAMTTSIPEFPDSGRNWDYRFCWIRDAYYTVEALNRLGALDVLEGYLTYLRNIVDDARGGHIQPMYKVMGEGNIPERHIDSLTGYRDMSPVRSGNDAFKQIQHDAYGQIVLSSAQAFFDERLFRKSGLEDFHALERVGDLAWSVYDKPDAGPWELRTKASVHTYSAAMCWAACDRLAKVAGVLGQATRSRHWDFRAHAMREKIIENAWRPNSDAISSTWDEDERDASLLQLLDLGLIEANDPMFKKTLFRLEKVLRRGDHLLRYAHEDDFGLPQTSFNVCTFWFIEALYLSGRKDEARSIFESMLSMRTAAGLLSEDIDPYSHEHWGNYPQTYSLVGIINCAVLLSQDWRDLR